MGIGAMRRSSVGKKRHRITVQSPTETKDEAHQPVVTWANRLTGEPASYEQVAGGEILRGRQVAANATCVFVVNYRAGYTHLERILFDSVYHEIVRIHKPEGIARFLELECRATGV